MGERKRGELRTVRRLGKALGSTRPPALSRDGTGPPARITRRRRVHRGSAFGKVPLPQMVSRLRGCPMSAGCDRIAMRSPPGRSGLDLPGGVPTSRATPYACARRESSPKTAPSNPSPGRSPEIDRGTATLSRPGGAAHRTCPGGDAPVVCGDLRPGFPDRAVRLQSETVLCCNVYF